MFRTSRKRDVKFILLDLGFDEILRNGKIYNLLGIIHGKRFY